MEDQGKRRQARRKKSKRSWAGQARRGTLGRTSQKGQGYCAEPELSVLKPCKDRDRDCCSSIVARHDLRCDWLSSGIVVNLVVLALGSLGCCP